MVPKFEEFFLPCLKCLSDGNVYTQELLRKFVIDYFKLSVADANALIKSGKKLRYQIEYLGLYLISYRLD